MISDNSTKIKVNLFFEKFPVQNQSYITGMVEELASRQKFKVGITCIANSDIKTDLPIKKIPNYLVRRVKERWHKLIRPNQKLTYAELYWLKSKSDIIHLHNSFLFNHVVNLLKMKKTNRPKIIITLRGGDTYVKPWIYKKWSEFYKRSDFKVDAFVVQSEHQKKYLNENWKVNLNNIKVIPSSIKTFDVSPKNLERKIVKIVSSFRLVWEKNIEGNLKVVRRLVDNGYNVSYDIFGDGPELGKLYFLVNKLSLNDFVNVKGRVDNQEYRCQLLDYDFYLQLSLSESLSISTIEAQSAGIPAIISDVGGMPSTIMNKKSGYLFAYDDVIGASEAIINLINDKNLYREFSQNAIANSQNKFNNAQEVNAYCKLYEQLLVNP